MSRLLHGLGERHARTRGFREIAGPQPMRRELPRIESGDGAVALDHGVDALRIERARADVAPLVDPPVDLHFNVGLPNCYISITSLRLKCPFWHFS